MSDEAQESEQPMTIEERLAYLEEQNEGLKKVGKMLLALSLLTAGLLVWTQMGQRSAVYSEALILGSGDTPRAALTTTQTNHLAWLFYDHMGILPPNPKFGAIPFLDGFAIYDRQGNPRVVIGINDKDQAVVDVLSAEGKVVFAANPNAAAPAAGGTPPAAPSAPAASTTPAPSAPAPSAPAP